VSQEPPPPFPCSASPPFISRDLSPVSPPNLSLLLGVRQRAEEEEEQSLEEAINKGTGLGWGRLGVPLFGKRYGVQIWARPGRVGTEWMMGRPGGPFPDSHYATTVFQQLLSTVV
jgi:hypothetical protein